MVVKLHVFWSEQHVGLLNQYLLGPVNVFNFDCLWGKLSKLHLQSLSTEQLPGSLPRQVFETLQSAYDLKCFLNELMGFGNRPKLDQSRLRYLLKTFLDFHLSVVSILFVEVCFEMLEDSLFVEALFLVLLLAD